MDVEKFCGGFQTESFQPRLESRGMFAQREGSKEIDLNKQLIKNKDATYFFKMRTDAMKDAGILEGDILVVDRAERLMNGKIVLVQLNGDTLVRRFHKNFSSAFLIPENERYKSINLAEFTEYALWGVVVGIFRQLA